jgi:delta 1-pyrroline-5-carboxylate dehydrogenase
MTTLSADALPDALGSQARDFISQSHRLLIGSERVEASDGRTFATLDPATGREIAHVAHAGAEDVQRAVVAAREAFTGAWGTMPAAGREQLILALAQALEDHGQELAEIESLDNGKPVGLALYVDVRSAAAHLRYFAGWPTKIEGGVLPVSAPNMLCYTRREPVGVCAQIVPWNFPLLMAAWKIAPALAAGCTTVLKPAEQTPLSALRLGELALEVGFPPGVLNVLTGDGATGAALVEHPDVDKIAFTGSTEVGREIGAKAGRALKRVTLELGLQRRLAPVRARRALRRGGGRSRRAGEGGAARTGARPADAARPARLRRAARARDGLHRLRPRAGCGADRGRRGGDVRQRRLLRRADPVQHDLR